MTEIVPVSPVPTLPFSVLRFANVLACNSSIVDYVEGEALVSSLVRDGPEREKRGDSLVLIVSHELLLRLRRHSVVVLLIQDSLHRSLLLRRGESIGLKLERRLEYGIDGERMT